MHYLVYDPRNTVVIGGKRFYGIPVAIYGPRKAHLIREWPPTHIVLSVAGDEGKTATETTAESFASSGK